MSNDARTGVTGRTTADVRRIVEDVVGCKWTLHVLAQVREGVNRPGQLVRTAEGLTTKVLNERLSKLVRFGVLEKVSYPEVPPRVEYHLTTFGTRLTTVLDAIDALDEDAADQPAPRKDRTTWNSPETPRRGSSG